MKSLITLPILIFLFCLPNPAQMRPGGGGTHTTPTRPQPATPNLQPETMIYISGKVVVDDGSVLTEPASIQSICNGQKRTEAHTDSHGSFNFPFGNRSKNFNEIGFDAETSSAGGVSANTGQRNLQECQLQASLPGFTSETVELAGRFTGNESPDVGRVVLHRVKGEEGATISVTTAMAPPAARKAFEKGQQQEKQGKLENAQKSFENAVALYPKFAVAWFELGRMQIRKHDNAGARHSFEQSIAADPKYISPYLGLTQVATLEQNWRQLAEVSAGALALNPVTFPEVWLSNSMANYFLQNLTAAEKSARRGLLVDAGHQTPKLEYLLGLVLLAKHSYAEAVQHLQAFLSLSKEPAEIAEAQKQLAEAVRLSASVQVAPIESK